MQETTTSPSAEKWIGLRVSFNHGGKRLVGTVLRAHYIGRTVRGDIPDFALTIAGASGATLENVSLVESYASFSD